MSNYWNKKLVIGIGLLILLRLISVLIIPHLPHLEQFRYSSSFSGFITGDDKHHYYLAELLAQGKIGLYPWTLGFPIMLVPFVWIFGMGFENIFLPVVIFQSIFLFSAALIITVWAAQMIFKRTHLALLTGLGFILFPYSAYILRNIGPHFPSGTWNDFNFFHLNWLVMMSDQLSALLVYLVFGLTLWSFQKKVSWRFFALIGFLVGYAMMTRVSNITTAIAILMIMLIVREYRSIKNIMAYGISALISFLPQFLYNATFFGSPFRFDYQRAYVEEWKQFGVDQPIFALGNAVHLIEKAISYSWVTIPLFIFGVAICGVGFYYLWKKESQSAITIGLWFVLPAAFYLFFTTGQTTLRYYMPIIPAFMILNVATVLALINFFKKCLEKDDVKEVTF